MVTVNLTAPPGEPFDPTNQTGYLLAPDGVTPIPFSTFHESQTYTSATALSILYGTQIGACFIMLVVVLVMTPRVRFRRVPTIINVAALTLNTVRMLLLAIFFTTGFLNFYVLKTGDTRWVPRSDFYLTAAATALSVPVTVLILAALVVQAWSMMSLWRWLYKAPLLVLSVLLVLATIAFNMVTTILQARGILGLDQSSIVGMVRRAYLGLITASIAWFCFLFNVRLVIHMVTNRSILPSLKGLKAMDVLVITNGILMIIPVVFAALEFVNWDSFESASLTQTSVIIVLPLGTLVAQRLASPTWFASGPRFASGPGSPAVSNPGRGENNSLTGLTGFTGLTGLQSDNSRDGTVGTAGAAAAGTAAARSPLASGGNGGRPGAVSTNVAGAGSQASVSSEKGRATHVDGEKAAARGVEPDLESGVRVDYGIERKEERVSTGSS